MLISAQDRGIVYVERTTGLEIILDATDSDVGHLEARFGLFRHNVNLDTR
jgi:hypothetical protein